LTHPQGRKTLRAHKETDMTFRDACQEAAQQLHDHEFNDNSDAPWLRWIAQAEKLAGHDLDGDQREDGYCLDLAYDAFRARKSPAAYVASIR
jgi:hypothetical protein